MKKYVVIVVFVANLFYPLFVAANNSVEASRYTNLADANSDSQFDSSNPGIQPDSSKNPGIQPDASGNSGVLPDPSSNPGIKPKSSSNPGIEPESSDNPGMQPSN